MEAARRTQTLATARHDVDLFPFLHSARID